MRFFKRNNLLASLLLFFATVVAQHLPSKNISINDGLPSNGIKCFFKDSRGLMWIGTEAGLCCYDGTSFKIYNETNGLKYSEVWAIAEDNDHNLWLSLYGKGLSKFDGKKFTFYDKKNGLINNAIRKIYYSKKHNCLVLGTENGLSLFDGKHFKSLNNKCKNVNQKFQVSGINQYEDKIIITVSYDNVYALSIEKNIQDSKLVEVFTPPGCYSSYIYNKQYFSGLAAHELFIRNLTTTKEEHYQCPISWDFTNDNSGSLYMASWNVTDPKGGLFKYYNHQLKDITQQANIKSTGLWCLYFEKESQQLWVGSIDKGIYIVDLSQQKKSFEPSFFGLKQLEIQCLFNDSNDNKWIGARDNIIILHKDLSYTKFDCNLLWKKVDDYFKQYGLFPFSIETLNIYKTRNSFTCLNIVEDKEGYIWVTTTLGTFCFDKKYNIRFFNFSQGGHIAFDENDKLLFGAMYSDMYSNPNKFDYLNTKQLSIKNKNIPRDIIKIRNNGNQIWFATYTNGLINYQNNTFYSLNLHNQFGEAYIKDIIINDKGELVIGSNSGRVYIAKYANNKLQIMQVYNPYKEMYGTSISFIQQSNGYYFIGTNKGVNVIKDHKFIKLINKSEGINDIQFNDCAKDKNGDLWIATNQNLLFLNVHKILTNDNLQNAIQITNLKVNGKNYITNSTKLPWEQYNNDNLKLAYNQNDIEVTYNNYNLFNADKNVYRYKIVGLTNTWSEFDKSTKIQLRGIPSGKYQLRIEGKNIGTGTLFKVKTLSILITPPFWKTWWCITLGILVLIILGLISYKKRVQYIEEREQAKGAIQKRLAETKMEALQSQMNPHFIFNAMNSIQNFIIDSNTDEALMYMGEFSKLIRQTLDNSSKQKISLADEIQYLKTYIHLETMRFKDAVDCKFTVSKSLDTNEVTIPPMLIQPFVENVFIHAFDSKSVKPTLEILFQKSGNLLLCEIKDNGKGMAKDNLNKLYTSKGIKLVEERINLLQQNTTAPIIIKSKNGKGTTVLLSLQIV
ncbi:MAG: histidine kinase [Flavobacterium sp.]